jgi:hypothetical protein
VRNDPHDLSDRVTVADYRAKLVRAMEQDASRRGNAPWTADLRARVEDEIATWNDDRVAYMLEHLIPRRQLRDQEQAALRELDANPPRERQRLLRQTVFDARLHRLGPPPRGFYLRLGRPPRLRVPSLPPPRFRSESRVTARPRGRRARPRQARAPPAGDDDPESSRRLTRHCRFACIELGQAFEFPGPLEHDRFHHHGASP